MTLFLQSFARNVCLSFKLVFIRVSYGTRILKICWIYLKSNSRYPKKIRYLLHWKPFKDDEKCKFLSCWSCRKNSLIRETKLISKFMASRPGYQTIVIHIFPNISGCKSNQAIKLGQSIDYNQRNIFFQKFSRQGD